MRFSFILYTYYKSSFFVKTLRHLLYIFKLIGNVVCVSKLDMCEVVVRFFNEYRDSSYFFVCNS